VSKETYYRRKDILTHISSLCAQGGQACQQSKQNLRIGNAPLRVARQTA
jgi:hypothetical protein